MNKKHALGILCLLVLCLIGYREATRHKKAQTHYLKNETHMSLIDQERFKKKLALKLPTWMQEQIDEDFQPFLARGISKEQVDATYQTIRKNLPEPHYIRYRIIDNTLYRYFPQNEQISLTDNGLEKTLKTLIHLFQLKDCDFLVGYIDGVPSFGAPPDFYQTADENLQAPLLVFARLAITRHSILIPDWRSIASWWTKDVSTVLSNIAAKPWDKKKEIAFWRGGLNRNERYDACILSQRFPESLDIKLVGDNLSTDLKQRGVVGDYTTLDQFMDYKYLPTFDGVICAYPAFQWRLLSNSLTLKQESDETQWFFRAVKPYVHYLPIKNDLSDLCQQIEWAKQHDAECQKMAQTAHDFALNNLMMEDHYIYLYNVLKKYASLQVLDKKALQKEMLLDDRWVCIQRRKSLRKKVKKEGRMAEYNRWISPVAFG